MEILLTGLNHNTAPVQLRERFAVADESIEERLAALRERAGVDETIVLSTCNRIELIGVSRHSDDFAAEHLFGAFATVTGGEPPHPEFVYQHRNMDAVRHIIEVASGLDSMILGEPEILGQVRRAYSLACRVGTNGLYTNRIMHAALRAGKRARSETEIGFGAASTAWVALLLARKVFDQLGKATVLIIGAGEAAESVARHFSEQGVARLIFTNRTEDRAVQLAMETDGEAVPFADLEHALRDADIVVSSTSAPGFIVDHETFHKVMDERHTRPVFLVDLAVPRDIDPEINGHDNAFLYDIDDLEHVADRNLDRRQAAIPQVRAIVEEELEAFISWRERLKVEPLVRLLHQRFNQVRLCELEKHVKGRGVLDEDAVERLTISIQKKLLHHPSRALRGYDPDTEEGRRALEIIREMFDL